MVVMSRYSNAHSALVLALASVVDVLPVGRNGDKWCDYLTILS